MAFEYVEHGGIPKYGDPLGGWPKYGIPGAYPAAPVTPTPATPPVSMGGGIPLRDYRLAYDRHLRKVEEQEFRELLDLILSGALN